MKERVRGLKRLAELYGQVEQIRSLQARAAASRVAEVVHAIDQEAAASKQMDHEGRTALRSGDRDGWALSSAQAEIAEVRQRRLEPLQVEREQVYQQAALAHRLSRQRVEQIDGIVDQAVARKDLKDARDLQASADDRYLSRRIWLRNQGAGKES